MLGLGAPKNFPSAAPNDSARRPGSGTVESDWQVSRQNALESDRGRHPRGAGRKAEPEDRTIFKASQRPSDSLAGTNEEHLNIQVLEYEKAAQK